MLTSNAPPRRNRSLLRRFLRSRNGIAAVEFSIILPMLLGLGVSGAELMRYLLIQKQISKAAEAVAMMMGVTETSFTQTDYEFIYDSTMVIVPFAVRDANNTGAAWRTIMNVGMSSIRFDKTSSGCTGTACATTPKVIWRTGQRTCGAQTYSSTPAMNTVPNELKLSVGSLVVADVSYT